MKRLPGIMMAIVANLIVLVALTVSGLRLALPHLDRFRPQIVSVLNRAFDAKIWLQQLHGSWQSFGPTFNIDGIDATTPDGQLQVQHVTLALDVWQSLLHWRWQFRDVTFYSLQLDLNTKFMGSDHHSITISYNRIFNFFLRQFDQIILYNSQLTFLKSSGERTRLSVPQLTWLNTSNRHRAEVKIALSSTESQQGMIDARMDLHDEQGLLNKGKFYFQTWNVDLTPWLDLLFQSNTHRLQSTELNLSAWIDLDQGKITGVDAILNRGVALWTNSEQSHRLDIDRLSIKINKKHQQQDAWQLDMPALNIAIDGKSWAPTTLSVFWLPAKYHLFFPDHTGEICLRFGALNFERLTPILSIISAVTPKFSASWHDLQPRGELTSLALDIPLNNASYTRFQAQWQDLSWLPWQFLPGADHVSGSVSGSLAAGRLTLALKNSNLPYQGMFRAPIALSHACATIDWRHNPRDGLFLWGRNIYARAQSFLVKGNVYFHKPVKGETWLDIIAGLHLTDATEAWRYYPEPLMGTHLVDYLAGAIKGGHVDNATLLFAGNPSRFPFKHNDGKFEIWAPLRQAEYLFESGWPALKQLDIDLNFVNNGLFMYTPQTKLGKNIGKNITASIPDYSKQQLLIKANISGAGSAIKDYFMQTPLKVSLGQTLDELQLSGAVMGDLHLDIPLNGQSITASGNIVLTDNSLYIKSMSTTLERLNGKLCYNNGNLDSDAIYGKWFGQPILINFTTLEKSTSFDVNVGIKGNWSLNALPNLPHHMVKMISGHADWHSDIAITMPIKGEMRYKIAFKSNLTNVSSYLPAPLYKVSGKPLTLEVNVQGDMHALLMSGHCGGINSFNSQWLLLTNQITMIRGNWEYGGEGIPPLPKDKSLTLSLPAINGEKWLPLLLKPPALTGETQTAVWLQFPDTLKLSTPALTLGRQIWHQLVLTSNKLASGSKVTAHGQEINGTLTILNHAPWRAELAYLYYNPVINIDSSVVYPSGELYSTSDTLDTWPTMLFTCQQCWLRGINIGRVSATITSKQDQLLLTSFVDTGKIYLTTEVSWRHTRSKNQTSLKGTISGNDIGDAADYLGLVTPLRDAPFNLDYDLHWLATPWPLDISSLNGVLHTQLGKGKIENISSGSAGRIMRLVSFNTLLRKLKFNFSDYLGKGFYFDFIKGTSWLKDGTLHTNDLWLDGLEANVAISGDIDLNRQQINIEAVIVPEILATVGVATAIIINPLLGAAVFAASKVLQPLWNKLSLIRYHISGNLDVPKITDIMHQTLPVKNCAKEH
ncbi:AsmA2 domain-containing protein YhdP [Candidatus Hoaglandella endobia]|uniref:YhdP central domain-containing protein n=1 Tax=Candidatus Hoaglandella endobia TaxID=1778263 RepID=A0A143WUJ5_9ENTR|nr:AsmA2 domain-containing protein YhdP [Candidatus Hoaglandella endobia]CUX97443.1 hypothetical protein TPER_HE00539 [Candidatus Hoaglandella endobia]